MIILVRLILILVLPVLTYVWLRKLAIRFSLNQRQFNMLLVVAAVLIVVVVLIMLGRLPVQFIVAPIMVAATFLLRNVHLLIRLFPLFQMFRTRTAKSAYGNAGTADASSIRTRYLLMKLEHNSGEMTGEVLEGTFRGAALSTLTMEQLLKLAGECSRDEDSLQILEAYLDRTHPEWRSQSAGAEEGWKQNAVSHSDSVMTEAVALEILGLAVGADQDAIVQAHRRLMQRMHPDRGGSDYLAKKINAARDFLIAD